MSPRWTLTVMHRMMPGSATVVVSFEVRPRGPLFDLSVMARGGVNPAWAPVTPPEPTSGMMWSSR